MVRSLADRTFQLRRVQKQLPHLSGAPTSTQLALLTTDLLAESKKHGAAKRTLTYYKRGVKVEKGGTDYGERFPAAAGGPGGGWRAAAGLS